MPAVLEARPPSVAAQPPAAPPANAPAEPEQSDTLATDVARAVRELRLGLSLSERGAARLLGTSQTQLRRMEDPRYLPSLRSLARLATAYGQRLLISFEPRDRAKAKREAAPVTKAARPERRPPVAKRPRARGNAKRRGRAS